MGSLILTFGGIAILGASGFAITVATKWFHTAEVNINELRKNKNKDTGVNHHSPNTQRGGSAHEARINSLHKRI